MKNKILILLLFSVFGCEPTKKVSATNPDNSGYENLIKQKKEMGIEFYAIGQEPGWTLDMDMEKGFSFKSYDGTAINTPPVQGVRAADANVIRYQAFVEMGELDFTIQQVPCKDVMSGRAYTHTVWGRIRIGKGEYKEYRGCGEYVNK